MAVAGVHEYKRLWGIEVFLVVGIDREGEQLVHRVDKLFNTVC